jgi:type II secretory pathway pseudopilin PulG
VSPLALVALGAAVAAVAILAAAAIPGAAKAATIKQTMTIYSVATLAQFINHQDDRQRAVNNNPFTADTKVNPPVAGTGPFAGDDTIYSFTLYKNVAKTKQAGTAVYTCHYNFTRHALCTAYFTLNTGVLLAGGPVDFNSTRFTLALTGGTKGFLGENGQVAMTPITRNEQQLKFELLGA